MLKGLVSCEQQTDKIYFITYFGFIDVYEESECASGEHVSHFEDRAKAMYTVYTIQYILSIYTNSITFRIFMFLCFYELIKSLIACCHPFGPD